MTLVLALPGGEELAARIAAHPGRTLGVLHVHHFPDGEQLVRVDEAVAGRTVVLAGSLDRPDAKLLPLLFAAGLLRELGAARIGLVTPYLPYMRQDARFQPGEAVTSASFAGLLCERLDFLLTVEPHLHRWSSLSDIYSIPAHAVGAATAIAGWLGQAPALPLLVGPDEESEQWVAGVATALGAPHAVLRKTRRGDFDVSIDGAGLRGAPERPAVLLDDLISTGRTLLAAASVLRSAGWAVHDCVCVHALFDGDVAARFAEAGLRVVSCNTVRHPSNAVDVTPAILATLAGAGVA
ncbi:MAG: ribose-phosphate diphosphokinase [Burkholderiales bacterium]|nr:ribose-phosphate diphosphokinase [Burkholderiales bacterium]